MKNAKFARYAVELESLEEAVGTAINAVGPLSEVRTFASARGLIDGVKVALQVVLEKIVQLLARVDELHDHQLTNRKLVNWAELNRALDTEESLRRAFDTMALFEWFDKVSKEPTLYGLIRPALADAQQHGVLMRGIQHELDNQTPGARLGKVRDDARAIDRNLFNTLMDLQPPDPPAQPTSGHSPDQPGELTAS